jgi:ribA/ribD-fused uncharacterized protein
MEINNKYYENDKYILFKSGYPSQWYPSLFEIDNKKYVNCEQYMMEQKAILFEDHENAKLIMETSDPKTIKELGRKVRNFDANKWNEVADEIVFKANYAKFTQNSNLFEILIKTGNKKYVECAPYDSIWGIGMDINTALITPEENWNGTNRLGKAIMRVRNVII